MKKLVIGTTKTVVVPAVLKEKQPSIDTLNVTPSTSAQTITAPSGTDGYSPVNVSAVTSSIDANIQAGNIKDGVTILGVTGNYQGGGSAPAYYIEYVKTNDNKLDVGSTPLDLTGIADIKDYMLYYSFYKDGMIGTNLLPVGNALRNTQDLKTLSGGYALYNCFTNQINITGTGLNYVETISGSRVLYNAFYGCSGLTDVGLENVTSITGSRAIDGIFSNCVALETVDFAKLVTIGSGSMSPNAASAPLTGCTKLSNVYFRAVKSTTFSGYLGALQYLFNSTTGSTATGGCTIHFPSNFDPSDPNHTFDASTLTGYPTFGGNASYIHVAFDLPATE